MINYFRPGYNIRVVLGVAVTPLLVYGTAQFLKIPLFYSLSLMAISWALGLFYLWTDRRIQLFRHTNLQLIGLHLILDNFPWVRDKYSEDELHELFHSCLSNDDWRNRALRLFRESSWRCVVDSHMKPVVYRWELKLKLPVEWSYEKEQLVFAAMILGCIPQQQNFVARWINGSITIRGGQYTSDEVPTRIEQVTPSLTFWKMFQLQLNLMLDTFSGYNQPIFVQGMVLDVFLEYPCAFLLKEGSSLRIDEVVENTKTVYTAKVTSSDGKFSNTQHYDSIDDLWWVWRHAIDKPVDLPEMIEKRKARTLRLRALLMDALKKHLSV